MSDSTLPAIRPKRTPVAGVLMIVMSLLLTAVYFRVPGISARWSWQADIFFRACVIAIGVAGGFQCVRATALRRLKFPAWFRLTQHWMAIPLEGWIYLGIMFVLFTGAMLTKQNTLLLVFAFMAGPFVINGWMTFGMLQAARVERNTPKRAMQGELFSVELTLRNRRPFFAIWMMSVHDEIEQKEDSLNVTVLFSRLSPLTAQSGQYQIRLSQRGRYRMGPLRISSRFPLGLVERSRVFSVTDEVLIYPRIGRISPHWRQRLNGATELVSRNQPHHGVFHDDFHRLREFRSGDNPRAIHWRSTARRGELVLREFHQNREHTMSIVLDLFAPPSSKDQRNETVEFALSFVASLLVERGRECRDGSLSLAATGKQTFRWEGNASNLESLFDGLALMSPGSSLDVAEILKETLQQSSSSTQILLVTTRKPDLPYESLLTPRIDVLNLNSHSVDQLLIFDDQQPFRRNAVKG